MESFLLSTVCWRGMEKKDRTRVGIGKLASFRSHGNIVARHVVSVASATVVHILTLSIPNNGTKIKENSQEFHLVVTKGLDW